MQRAAAVAQLQEVVVAQLAVAEAEGAFCCTEDKLNVTRLLIVTFFFDFDAREGHHLPRWHLTLAFLRSTMRRLCGLPTKAGLRDARNR